MRFLGAAGLLGLALPLSACTLEHKCSEVYYLCERTILIVQSPNDAWTPSSYVLAMDIDGAQAQCTLEVANSPERATSVDCAAGTNRTLTLEPVLTQPPLVCDQTACGGSSAVPVAGHFQLLLVLQMLPKEVAMNLTRDGTVILNKVVSPARQTDEPNGHGCGQCTNAQSTLMIGS
jgi:hypothetical protein